MIQLVWGPARPSYSLFSCRILPSALPPGRSVTASSNRWPTAAMRFKAKTMVAVLLTFIVGCRASSPEDSKRTLSLIPSDRVVQKSITRQCNQGGQSNVPVVKSGPIQCPCFFEWRFYPDKESLWNIFVIPEAAFLAWRDRQYTGRPARYLAEYSDLSLKGVSGKVVARPKTNIMSVDKLVVAFQSKSETTVCMGTASFESSTTATESRNSFLVFESMPEECPVVVPNPPVRIGSRKAPVAVEHRVVGGSLAAADNGLATYFPWIAIIWLGTSRSICGGSHIAPGFILTAAHCRIQDSVDSFNVRIGNEEYDEGERFFIKRMWVHEKYRLLTNGEALYDIAIIEISDRNTSKDGDLIALNKNPDRPEAGDYLTTAGYGHLAEDWPKPLDPNPLRKVDVPMWDIEDCQNKFPAVSPTLHICAGKGGCDSCQYVIASKRILSAIMHCFLFISGF